MTKRIILLLFMTCLATFAGFDSPNQSQAIESGELELRLKEAEGRYSAENYLKSREIFIDLSRSFPSNPHYSYFQFMIAKCDYHLKDYPSAGKRFADFIHQFPQSDFVPACYLILGNIAHLEGAAFQSAQNLIFAYELADSENLRLLAKRSLQPLLERWLSEAELDKLSRSNKDKKLAPKIWFYLGTRQHAGGDFEGALKTLNYYQRAFPYGEDIQEVDQLLEDFSSGNGKTIKLGVLLPLTGDLSLYGISVLNGIKLALSFGPSGKKEIQLVVRDTQGDFVNAARLCRELISNDKVTCILGPLKSEAVAAAVVEAERAGIPLITPTASRKGLASLSDFVFQVSPTAQRKGRTLAEVAVKDEGLRELVLLVPEFLDSESEAANFETRAEGLGAKILITVEYSPEVEDFSLHLRGIKNRLMGLSSSSSLQEEESFLDEVPVWVEGIFISADQTGMYDILSRIAKMNIFGTILGTEVCGEKQVVEFARNIDRKMIFVSNGFNLKEATENERFFDLYFEQYRREPDLFSMLGFDCMMLLTSIMERTVSPRGIRGFLARTSGFAGISGGISFDPEGENTIVPVYKLEGGRVKRLR
jgi:branched-chain amino acid transport system substrate-binding protein